MRKLLASAATVLLLTAPTLAGYGTMANDIAKPIATRTQVPPLVKDWAKQFLVNDCDGYQPDYTIHEKPKGRTIGGDTLFYGTTVMACRPS
jgi:hypothetical protein